MDQKLFIPTKIKVGYQDRHDTYTKRLAYVIYYDQTGKLRKEKSWESWRSKKIAPDEFENKPHSGFVLNKGVKRYGHWGSGRSMVRVYDDRGIEFEITISNLMFILMTTNCHKRGLEGDFVYAWAGTELVLLPTGCEEYEESKDFTKIQSNKISANDLIVGASYKTKKLEDYIYMGRFDWYEYTTKKNGGGWYNRTYERKKKPRQHVFYHKHSYGSERFFTLSSTNSLASINSDTRVSNYAELMGKLSQKLETKAIDKIIENKFDHKFNLNENDSKLEKHLFIKEKDGTHLRCKISLHKNWQQKPDGYTLAYNGRFTFGDNYLKKEPDNSVSSYSYHYSPTVISPETLNSFEMVTVKVKLENGEELSLDSLY